MRKTEGMMKNLNNKQCDEIPNPGDKFYVIESEALFGWDDDYYDIFFPIDVLEKTVKEVNVLLSGYYVIWFTDNTSRKPNEVYKTYKEAHDEMMEQLKNYWKNNDCDVLLEKLLKIKNRIDFYQRKMLYYD